MLVVLDFTCVCILDAFKNDAASKAMERVLKLVSENRAKEIMKVSRFCRQFVAWLLKNLHAQTKKPRLPSPTFVSAYLDSFRPGKTHTLVASCGSDINSV